MLLHLRAPIMMNSWGLIATILKLIATNSLMYLFNTYWSKQCFTNILKVTKTKVEVNHKQRHMSLNNWGLGYSIKFVKCFKYNMCHWLIPIISDFGGIFIRQCVCATITQQRTHVCYVLVSNKNWPLEEKLWKRSIQVLISKGVRIYLKHNGHERNPEKLTCFIKEH